MADRKILLYPLQQTSLCPINIVQFAGSGKLAIAFLFGPRNFGLHRQGAYDDWNAAPFISPLTKYEKGFKEAFVCNFTGSLQIFAFRLNTLS